MDKERMERLNAIVDDLWDISSRIECLLIEAEDIMCDLVDGDLLIPDKEEKSE